VYEQYVADIIQASEGQPVLKVPLDVAQDIPLPAVVANNPREEKIVQEALESGKEITLVASPSKQATLSKYKSFIDKKVKSLSKPSDTFGKMYRDALTGTTTYSRAALERAIKNHISSVPQNSYARALGAAARNQTASLNASVGAITFNDPTRAPRATPEQRQAQAEANRATMPFAEAPQNTARTLNFSNV
jgi:hypothetical protein